MIRLLKYIGIVVLLALAACNSYEKEYEKAEAVLQEAERLYQHPHGERSDYTGADTVQISQELTDAAEFFVKREDFWRAAKAALYCGYAQKENDDKIFAMKSFKDAEQYGTISGDSLTTARAQYNIAKMLLDEHNPTEAITIANISDTNFGNNNYERAYANNLIAISYIAINDYDMANKYLEKGLILADKGQSKNIKSKILNNYSIFYRNQGKYKKAIECLLRSRELETDSSQIFFCDLNMGVVYLYDDQYDSANYYMHKALDLSEITKVRPSSKVSVYFYLYYIAKEQGNYKKSLAYHEIHEKLQYDVLKESEKKNIYSINRRYDYEVLQNNMNKQIINRQRIILIISLILLLVSIVMIVSLVRQKNILKENKLIKQELDKTKDELQNSVKFEVVEKELSRQLHLIIKANKINGRADDFKKEWSPLVYKINNEKDNMFEAAKTAIERVYPEMYVTIQKNHPDFNDTESKVLLLSCSDLSNTEIGYILGLSVHTVNKSRSEIRRKII